MSTPEPPAYGAYDLHLMVVFRLLVLIYYLLFSFSFANDFHPCLVVSPALAFCQLCDPCLYCCSLSPFVWIGLLPLFVALSVYAVLGPGVGGAVAHSLLHAFGIKCSVSNFIIIIII